MSEAGCFDVILPASIILHPYKNMTFKSPQTLKTIAELIGAKFVGDENFQVLATNEIHRVKLVKLFF